MKKLLLLFTTIFFLHTGKAQLTITDSLSNLQIANLLEGIGVTITNLTVNCPSTAIGQFNGTSEMSITNGIVLSTGSVDLIASPNNSSSTSHNYSNPGDSLLDSIAAPVITYDACLVEFDCLPTGDTLEFNFSFGSEEYMEYVSSTPGGINDVFGVFLSGPGINGEENIATLPNGIPVSIFNVNANSNSTYYYNNEAPAGNFIQYDGFTTNLRGFAVVNPNLSYHVKVGIADGGDGIFDSGVFIEAFSFKSLNGISTTTGNLCNPSNLVLFPNPTYGAIQVKYTLKQQSPVQVGIHDVTGKVIKNIFEGNQASGEYKLDADVENLTPGFYIVSVQTNYGTSTSKLLVK